MKPHTGSRPTPSDITALYVIAQQAGVSLARVEACHREEWQRLADSACIRDFIPVLALKHVRDIFRHPAFVKTSQNMKHKVSAPALMPTQRVAPG